MDYQLKTPLLPIKNEYTVVERVFAIRGVDPKDIPHYLNTTEKDILDPGLIMNIDEGVRMLARHISQQDKIYIQVDSDCDGFTSAAFLINYLNRLFPGYTQTKISYGLHAGKQHGLYEEFIPDFINEDYKLIIAPDSSSNNYEVHKKLKELGIDVLVIDHHEAEKISEDACVINNQLCDYPTKSLSGVGMVYKFCSYFDSIMGTDWASYYLDLAALGIIADMMDIRDFETREIINLGLASVENPFFKEMVKVQDYSISRAGGLCPFAVSFYIAPQVNGTIRMGSANEKLMLFESMLDFKAYDQIPSTKRGCKGQFETRVEQACRNCTNIKRNQSKAIDASLQTIEGIIKDKSLEENKIIAVKLAAGAINKNLTGLIANQLMAKYNHPFLILMEHPQEDGSISLEGSGRSYETSNFNDLRTFIRDSGYASLAEGHPNAFGAAIPEDKFSDFIQYSNEALKECSFTPCQKVDFIWDANDFKANDIIDLAELNTIWGQELAEPIVVIKNVKVTKDNLSYMGKGGRCPSFKITLPNGTSLIKFRITDEEFDSLLPTNATGSKNITVIGTCAINEWNGRITPQIKVSDYEITGETKYYF